MITHLKRSIIILICIWTLMLGAIYGVVIYLHSADTLTEAVAEARHYYAMNMHYRAWNSQLGGLYANAAKVPPNPYLTHPQRDVTLSDGTRYTLVNPAYMTRMVFDAIKEAPGPQVISKITSLTLLNPVNAPDAWESDALRAFDQGGVSEKFEKTVIANKPYLRFIAPFKTESGCLKCHGHQGYHVGDIRGGISIAIPLETHLAADATIKRNLAVAFSMLWLLGCTGITLTGRKHIHQAVEVNTYRDRLLDKIRDLEASKNHVEQLSSRLSIVMDGIPALVAHVDSQQRYIYVNRSYAQWAGVPQDELIGKTVQEVVGEKTCAQCKPYIEAVLQGRGGNLEHVSEKSGNRIVQHISFVPQVDDQGRVPAFFAFITDITASKKTEASLRESEIRHRTILQTALDGFWRCNLQGRLLEVNEAYCIMSGYSEEELLGMGIEDLEASESPIDIASHMNRVVSMGEDRFETRHRCKDGSTFPVEVSVQYRREGEYFVVFLRDMTDTKRKNALSEAQLHLVQFALDHTLGELLEETLNEAEKLTGSRIGFYHFVSSDQSAVTLQNWSSRTKQEFCKAEGQGNHYDIAKAGVWVDCVRQNRPVIHNDYASLPHRKGMPEGHAEVVRELVVPVMRGGKIMAILGVGNKPTDYTLEDLDTVSLLADLGWEVVERKQTEATLREIEQQLFQSQKMEAIGQLAGGIAHDFNNLLQAINSFAFLAQMQLQEHHLPAQFAEEIIKAGKRAAELTTGLLAFSRKQAINPKQTELNSIIEDTHKLLSRVLSENIDFSISYNAASLMVMADAGQIQQVLINLATNARDAMPEGGTLRIATGRATIDDSFITHHGYGTKGDYATITVSDTGHGMESDLTGHIFEPFFTTKEQGKGTGLGLSIVYGIVKQHNGFITVESQPGRGTAFRIYLQEVTEQEPGGDQATGVDAIPHGDETILVVDDEDMVRASLGSILAAYGYRVVEASNGRYATELFQASAAEIGLVIMDILMPHKSGDETLREMRGISAQLPAIFISGYTEEILAIHNQLDDQTALLMKPVHPVEILKTIRRLLDRKGAESESSTNR